MAERQTVPEGPLPDLFLRSLDAELQVRRVESLRGGGAFQAMARRLTPSRATRDMLRSCAALPRDFPAPRGRASIVEIRPRERARARRLPSLFQVQVKARC